MIIEIKYILHTDLQKCFSIRIHLHSSPNIESFRQVVPNCYRNMFFSSCGPLCLPLFEPRRMWGIGNKCPMRPLSLAQLPTRKVMISAEKKETRYPARKARASCIFIGENWGENFHRSQTPMKIRWGTSPLWGREGFHLCAPEPSTVFQFFFFCFVVFFVCLFSCLLGGQGDDMTA